MAAQNFTPAIWAKEIHLVQRRETILAGVVNHDYEGEIRGQGDTVHINGLVDVSTGTYDRTAGLGTPERLNTNRRTLLIDQAQKFDFLYDDIEAAQNNPKLIATAAAEASRKLLEVKEDFVLGKMVTDGTAFTGGAVTLVDAKDLYNEVLVPGRTQLRKANAPRNGVFMIVDADTSALLSLDDRVIASGAEAADSRFVNGVVTRLGGITVIESNSPAVAGKVIIGHQSATTHADQIVKTRAMESENWFGTRVNGLDVYGTKVVRPENLVVFDLV